MKQKLFFSYLLLFLLFTLLSIPFTSIKGQYLENPSLEGNPGPNIPPPPWLICNPYSTPDILPGVWGVGKPASDGITYLGMTARIDGTHEDVQSSLMTTLSPDSCYLFQIDLAYTPWVAGLNMLPISLKVYGEDLFCAKSNLLWESGPIDNEDWDTYEFYILPAFEIKYLILEAQWSVLPHYHGYILVDNVRIKTTPDVELGNDTTLYFCEEDSLILNAGSGYFSYLWQDGSTDSTFVVDTTGLYWVQVSNEVGCTASDSIYITIVEYEDMITEMPDTVDVCEGGQAEVSINVQNGCPPYSFEWWYLPDTLATVTFIPDSSMYYGVTITDNCDKSISDSVYVNIYPGPKINLGPDTTICDDDILILHAGGGFLTYTWQDGSGDSTYTVTESGTYWVEITSPGNCHAWDTIVVNEFPPIQLDIGNGSNLIVICEGDSVVLNAGAGFASYLWQDLTTTDSVFIAKTEGWYWVTVESIYGCDATDSVFIQVDPLPVVDLGIDTLICSGEDLLLDAGPGFLTYTWQGTIQGTQFFTVSEPGTYCVEVTNACGGTEDCIEVGMYPEPVVDLGPDTTICFGQSVLLDAGSGYIEYEWMDGWTLQYYDAAQSGYYTVTVTDIYGCSGGDEVNIGVSDPEVELGPDTLFCEGETILLDAGAGYELYVWQDGSDNQTYTVSEGGYYSVVIYDQHGCTDSSDIVLEKFPQPTAVLEDYHELCQGDTLTLYAPEGNFTYYWNGVEGPASYNVFQDGVFLLEVVNACGTASDQTQVDVFPIPEIYLGEDDIRYPGEVYELDGGNFTTYTWQDGSFDRYFAINDENVTEDNFYYVEIFDGHCKSSDTIFIEEFKIEIPNVFTPNGDGKNDDFRPSEISGLNDYKLVIFNRWGSLVHEMNNLNDAWN
ncbi:MAG: gliding motility-associated C-terminal domain-containing protein, partial [Bacteroidales bacterium]|nr:gliding motility-associated C-terminal domain-containing protein [Bacteroidales bacterium]